MRPNADGSMHMDADEVDMMRKQFQLAAPGQPFTIVWLDGAKVPTLEMVVAVREQKKGVLVIA